MSEMIFIPTPNWFTSRPVDILPIDGTLAVSALSSILLTNNLLESYSGTIKDAHTKRILCLSFYKGAKNVDEPCYLASCSEDLEVKVWNPKTNVLINQHKLHQVC